MTFEHSRAIADAILYEGYVLYPYRASSKKNQWRWQFGLLAPREWSEAGGCEPWVIQTECLLESSHVAAANGASNGAIVIRGSVRALRVQRRKDAAEDHGVTTWDEGVEVEIPFSHAVAAGWTQVLDINLEGERSVAPDCVRELETLAVRISISSEDLAADGNLVRLRVRVENQTRFPNVSASRDDVLPAALAGVHTLLAAEGATFLSSVDPPEFAAARSRECVNKGAFPVLVGASGGRDEMLASPIILYDHPAIAPESPGDLCDATEIDEILTLRTYTLTDDEKREARRTDARAAAIVDRVDRMPANTLEKLHGVLTIPAAPAAAPITRGARVRLRPRRRADAQDMFLVGRLATVEQVKEDVDGNSHVAVTVDDDPATELHRWYGRFLYFAPDEVELVDGERVSGGKS
jgi:hypothetical protein